MKRHTLETKGRFIQRLEKKLKAQSEEIDFLLDHANLSGLRLNSALNDANNAYEALEIHQERIFELEGRLAVVLGIPVSELYFEGE